MSAGWPEAPHSIHRLWKDTRHSERAQQWDLGPSGTVLRSAICYSTYRRAPLPASWSSGLVARDSQCHSVCTSVSPERAWGFTWDHAASLVHRQPRCCSDLCSEPERGLPLPQYLRAHWRRWVRQDSCEIQGAVELVRLLFAFRMHQKKVSTRVKSQLCVFALKWENRVSLVTTVSQCKNSLCFSVLFKFHGCVYTQVLCGLIVPIRLCCCPGKKNSI